MLDEIKAIKSEKRDLRNFGLIMAAALAVICFILLHKGAYHWSSSCSWLSGLAVTFTLCGLIIPPILFPLQKIWMTLAVIMGFFMTRIILGVLFYLVFTPIHFIAALVGKRFLDVKLTPNASTYWNDRSHQPLDRKRCERQY